MPRHHVAVRKKFLNLQKGSGEIAKTICAFLWMHKTRAMAYSYAHRKLKKRDFRNFMDLKTWSCCKDEMASRTASFIFGLKKAGCEINRKMLSELAISSPEAFTEVVHFVRKAALAS